MSYNSDGYIMLDFNDISFNLNNQTVDGLFNRIKSIVGSNKFVIILNANHGTPLPAAVQFVNNSYVITTSSYSFTITSDDNLRIKVKRSADELIDDSHKTTYTTYSSNKIESFVSAFVGSAISPFRYYDSNFNMISGSGAMGISVVDPSITDNSVVQIYTSVYGVNPKTVNVHNHQIDITFDDPGFDFNVKVRFM